VEVSARTGAGMPTLYDWIRAQRMAAGQLEVI